MNKRDALKLGPGDEIAWGDKMWSAQTRIMRTGTVVRVTPAGGILVRDVYRCQRDGPPMAEPREVWVPYHHVV